MTPRHRAYLWGLKAAQDDHSDHLNPYRDHQARAAWKAGLDDGLVLRAIDVPSPFFDAPVGANRSAMQPEDPPMAERPVRIKPKNAARDCKGRTSTARPPTQQDKLVCAGRS